MGFMISIFLLRKAVPGLKVSVVRLDSIKMMARRNDSCFFFEDERRIGQAIAGFENIPHR
jgi:hypothetical protein